MAIQPGAPSMEMRQAPPQPESATPERYRLQPVQEQNKGIVGWLKSKMTNESPRQIMQELAARPSPLTSTETESFRTQYKREVMTPEQINDALATKRVEYQSVTDLHDSKKVHEIPQPILENRLNAYKQEVATLQGRLQKMQAEPNTNPQDLHKLQTEINRASHTLKGLERTATARQPIIDNLKTALNDPNIPNYELAMYMTMNPAQSDKVSPKDFRYDVRAQAARGALQTRMKSADSGTLQRWSDGIDPKRESDPHRRHAMEALKSMVNTEITTKTKAAEAKVAQIRAEAAPVSTDPKVTPEVSPTPAPAEVVAPPATETAADLPINDQARKDKVKQKILDGYLEWKSKNQGLLDAGGEAAEEAEIQAIDNLRNQAQYETDLELQNEAWKSQPGNEEQKPDNDIVAYGEWKRNSLAFRRDLQSRLEKKYNMQPPAPTIAPTETSSQTSANGKAPENATGAAKRAEQQAVPKSTTDQLAEVLTNGSLQLSPEQEQEAQKVLEELQKAKNPKDKNKAQEDAFSLLLKLLLGGAVASKVAQNGAQV